MRTEKSAGNEKNCTQKRLEHSRNARRQCWNTVEMRTACFWQSSGLFTSGWLAGQRLDSSSSLSFLKDFSFKIDQI